jgi:hypothetical protein
MRRAQKQAWHVPPSVQPLPALPNAFFFTVRAPPAQHFSIRHNKVAQRGEPRHKKTHTQHLRAHTRTQHGTHHTFSLSPRGRQQPNGDAPSLSSHGCAVAARCPPAISNCFLTRPPCPPPTLDTLQNRHPATPHFQSKPSLAHTRGLEEAGCIFPSLPKKNNAGRINWFAVHTLSFLPLSPFLFAPHAGGHAAFAAAHLTGTLPPAPTTTQPTTARTGRTPSPRSSLLHPLFCRCVFFLSQPLFPPTRGRQ